MFKGLRLRLTATYTLAALGLVLLAGLGTYGLLGYYFQSDNDAALRYRVALEYESLGVALPHDLEAAKANWEASHAETDLTAALPPGLARQTGGSDVDESEGERGGPPWADYPDSALAALFVLRLAEDGSVVTSVASAGDPAPAPIAEGLRSANATPDVRTVSLGGGGEIRVATYRLPSAAVSGTQPIAYVQVGRMLTDQNHLLGEVLIAVLLACAGAAVAVGAASWYLAGRSLRPALEAWDRQQAFVANASHELRTPVTLIRASAEYALKQHKALTRAKSGEGVVGTDPTIASVFADVLTETDHLGRLVDDLLLLSRIDAGKLELTVTSVPVPDLLEGVGRSFGRLADEKRVTLHTSAEDVSARADPTRLRQVILILLDNALRHTPPHGSISLQARSEGRRVVVVVADTGSGIDPQEVSRVFDRFYQARKADEESAGTGLGLAIAKSLVERQKGRIHITSRLGEGTTVTLQLPRASRASRA
jgi:signal transduction histidine kinase